MMQLQDDLLITLLKYMINRFGLTLLIMRLDA
jgi:hypothetical protein